MASLPGYCTGFAFRPCLELLWTNMASEQPMGLSLFGGIYTATCNQNSHYVISSSRKVYMYQIDGIKSRLKSLIAPAADKSCDMLYIYCCIHLPGSVFENL